MEHAKIRTAKGAQKGLSHPLKRSFPDSFLPPIPPPFFREEGEERLI